MLKVVQCLWNFSHSSWYRERKRYVDRRFQDLEVAAHWVFIVHHLDNQLGWQSSSLSLHLWGGWINVSITIPSKFHRIVRCIGSYILLRITGGAASAEVMFNEHGYSFYWNVNFNVKQPNNNKEQCYKSLVDNRKTMSMQLTEWNQSGGRQRAPRARPHCRFLCPVCQPSISYFKVGEVKK